MHYLNNYKNSFQHCVRLRDLTVHAQDEAASHILSPIAELLKRRGEESLYRKLAGCLSTSDTRYFVKTASIDGFQSRLRATFGPRRSDGGHAWLVEEMRNSVEAFHRGAPVPQVAAFGYQRRGLWLVREFFLVSQMLDNHLNAMEWIQTPGVDIESFLLDGFALFKQLHDREVFHLDLWLGNIMLSPHQPEQLYVVDLENCHVGETKYVSEVLGFQFGFLFFRFLHEYIPEARYDELVNDALRAYLDIDKERFMRVYEVVKRQPINRKKRRLLALQGVLRIS